jgi:hypothetical protein
MYNPGSLPRQDSFWLYVGLSLLIHASVFGLYHYLNQYKDKVEEVAENIRIPVRIQPQQQVVVPPMRPDKPMLIDDNEGADDIKPDKADILSTQNSQANDGVKRQRTGEEADKKQQFIPEGAAGFSSDLVGRNLTRESDEKSVAQIDRRLTNTMARLQGPGADFSLSSYAWEWAPWVLDLKHKFERTINPPPVYTRLGLVSGVTRVRFVINRDGTLADYEILFHKGHNILENTTIESIEAVFPFKRLPKDFPDTRLTIVGTFYYPDLRQLYRRN